MSLDTISIQPYSPIYREQVIDLILPIQQTEFGIAITAADQPDLQTIPSFYQHGAGNFWLALDNSQVVGTIALLDIGSHTAALRKMFVHAEYRGKVHGVAQRLLDTLLAWAQRQAVQTIYLGTTAKYLAAHRFYARNGFREIPQVELPPSFPVMQVDTKFFIYAVPYLPPAPTD